MGTVVLIDLVRLRSATATYLAILYDSLPTLESLTSADSAWDQHDAELMARLRDTVEAALDIDDAPGTPAAILTTLCHLLGSAPPPRPPRSRTGPPSASVMQVHLSDGILDDGDDDGFASRWTREHS